MITNTKATIIDYIRQKKQVRIDDLVHILGISHVAVHKQVKKLVQAGILRRVGSPPRVYYVLAHSQGHINPAVSTLDQIKKMLKMEKPTLEREYNISKMGIFGSYVFGDFTSNSDIDIIAEFHRPVGLFQFIALENHLSKVLGRTVDLVSNDGLKPSLKDGILRSAVYV